MTDSTTQELTYEAAFSRLEEILEQLSSDTLSLDTSLQMYEEATQLLTHCNRRLTEAEQRIEILSKGRGGELLLNSEGKPSVESFSS